MLQEEQGWRTAAWVRFPGVTCGLSLLLVLVLAQRIQVSPSFLVFLSPQKKTDQQTSKKTKKTIQIRPGSREQEEPPRGMAVNIPAVFRVVCTNSASSSIQMVERRATIKEVEGLGLRPDLHQGSKDLNDRGEFIANYLTINSSLVRTPNRAVVSCTFAVIACPLQTVEHKVLGDVICPLFTGVAQKIFFVPLPVKYISKRKLVINQKVN